MDELRHILYLRSKVKANWSRQRTFMTFVPSWVHQQLIVQQWRMPWRRNLRWLPLSAYPSVLFLHPCWHYHLNLGVAPVEVRTGYDTCFWETLAGLSDHRCFLLRRRLVRTQIGQSQVQRTYPAGIESVKDLDDAAVGQVVGHIVVVIDAAGQGK